MVATVRESNKRKCHRKIVELKLQSRAESDDRSADLAAVRLKFMAWAEAEPWIRGEAIGDFTDRQIASEDEESHYHSDVRVLDEPRFSFWYDQHRDDWLKITEGKHGKRVRIRDATQDHWRAWLMIRDANFERARACIEADRLIAGEHIREFGDRPHCNTTEELMREAHGWREQAEAATA